MEKNLDQLIVAVTDLTFVVDQQREIIDKQQIQIQNLITANRNIVDRLNKLDKRQRDDHQGMW